MDQPKLLDVVALLQPVPFDALELTDERYDLSSGLAVGTVGTVVEVFSLEFYQLSSKSGQTSEMLGGCLDHPIALFL